MRTMLLALLLFVTWPGAYARGPGLLPAPVDLHADGIQSAEQGKPVVILFSLADCAYCEVVRKNYLAPLLRDERIARRPIIREVDVSGNERFAGFQREQISHRELANRYGVHFAPTVIFVDGSGNLLTKPIVGGDTAGMYGGYLDNAFAEATRKLGTRQPIDTMGEEK
jgi:thioredoxin-related protein